MSSNPTSPITAPNVNTPLLPTCLSGISTNLTWAGEPEAPGAPEKNATIFAASMNLAACALGASMLSLPYTMMISGPIVALQFLIFFAIMAFFAAQAVVNAGLRSKKSNYADIVRHYFGSVQGTIADVLLAIALIVAAISYIVGLVDLLPDLIPFTAFLSRTMRIILILICLFPVTLIGSLAVFGPASAFAVAGCYIQAFALVLQLFTASSKPDGTPAWTSPAPAVWSAVSLPGLIYSMPMICFVYAFHYVLTDTLGELETPTRMRMAKVNFISIAMMLGCYFPVALSGYLVLSGDNIPTNVLTALAAGSPAAFIAKLSIGALLLITYSLFIIPLRRKLEIICFASLTESMKSPKRIMVAAFLNAFVCIASIGLPDLGLANTLAGGCIALIMFFFPGRLMLRHQLDLPFENRDPLRMGIGGIFVFSGTLICLVGLFGNMIFNF